MNKFSILLSLLLISFCSAQVTQVLTPSSSGEFFELPTDGSVIVENISISSDMDSLFIFVGYDLSASVKLINPLGEVIEPNEKVIENIIQQQYIISNPLIGDWELQMTSNGYEDKYAFVEVFKNDTNGLVAGLLVDYNQIATIPTTISLALFDNGLPVNNADVDIILFHTETGEQRIVKAMDNGDISSGDAFIGDGIYSFSEILPVGFYYAMASATLENGEQIASNTMFAVYIETARLTGEVFDESIDINDDELIDGIRFRLPLEFVKVAGGYSAQILITASNGNTAYSRLGYRELSTESTEITAEYSASDLKEKLGVDGPYQITQVQFLWDPKDHTIQPPKHLIQTLRNLGSTQDYALNDLDRPYLIFQRLSSDKGIDTNDNGQYDFIEVVFEIDSAFIQDFDLEWNARLVPVAGLPTEGRAAFAQNSGLVTHGTNQLSLQFPIEEYGLNGIGRPFLIENLTIYSPIRLPDPYSDLSGDEFRDFPDYFPLKNVYSVFTMEGYNEQSKGIK